MTSSSDPRLARSATEIDRRIGLRIRARRLQLGMSQEKLAGTIGVSFQQVQKYEKGTNRVSASMLLFILQALNMTPAELYEGIGAGEMSTTDPMIDADAVELVKAFASFKTPAQRKAALAVLKAIVKTH